MNDTAKRPEGCPFHAYGADPELLRTLTCGNCPLVPMLCECKAAVVLKRLAEIFRIEIVSEP